jgi:hypothetical protein
MRVYDYPDFAEHEALKTLVVKFQQDFESGRAAITVSGCRFSARGSRGISKAQTGNSPPCLKQRAVV